MQKRWSKAEIAYLERNARSRSLEELAKHFKTDVGTVERQLTKIQVPPPDAVVDDPDLDVYDKALGLMHGGKWKQAAELFDKIADQTDSPHLADRARQNRVVCRHRLAKEDGSQDDPYLQAVFEKNEGNFDTARELCKKHGKLDQDERFAYLAASVEALAGSADRAVGHLATAIRLEPKNRVHAFHDPDFKSLRGSEAFAQLIAAPRST